jgi:hypothetical protein
MLIANAVQKRVDSLARDSNCRQQTEGTASIARCFPEPHRTENKSNSALERQTNSVPAARWIGMITKRALTTWRARLLADVKDKWAEYVSLDC